MTRLEEIRRRWEKVTPGPWRWSNTSSEAYLFGARSLVVMAFKRMGMNGAQPVFRREDNILYPAGKENINAFPDARAIATAPEDIAFLLGKIERFEALAAKFADSPYVAVAVAIREILACSSCGGSGVVQESHDGGTHPVHCPEGCPDTTNGKGF